jgi:hypothetical protein
VWAAPDLTPTTVLRVSTTPISTETCVSAKTTGAT